MIWKQISGFSDYEVSDDGRVRFVGGWRSFGSQRRYIPPGERKLAVKANGYMQVTIYNERRPANKYVHRLVAEAFVPNPDKLPEINHKDGNKQRNRHSNLEWVSSIQNKEHARAVLGIDFSGERHGMAKITEIEALEIIRAPGTHQDIADRYGVSRQQVGNIKNGLSWAYLQTTQECRS